MPLIFYVYVILPNLILGLLLWLTCRAKGFVLPYTLLGMIVAWGFFFSLSVMWAMGMVEQDYRALFYGLCLISGCIGMLIGTFLRDRRWRKRQSEENELI